MQVLLSRSWLWYSDAIDRGSADSVADEMAVASVPLYTGMGMASVSAGTVDVNGAMAASSPVLHLRSTCLI